MSVESCCFFSILKSRIDKLIVTSMYGHMCTSIGGMSREFVFLHSSNENEILHSVSLHVFEVM